MISTFNSLSYCTYLLKLGYDNYLLQNAPQLGLVRDKQLSMPQQHTPTPSFHLPLTYLYLIKYIVSGNVVLILCTIISTLSLRVGV